MEIDLKEIKKIGKQKENENWEFRLFLKHCVIPSEQIDKKVHALFEKYSSKIDCTKCANCCKEITPKLNQKDIESIASHLGISELELRERYLKKNSEGEIVFRSKICPFLSSNKCKFYESRPEACQSFPHLQKVNFTSRTIQTCINYSICPIVFNVYEDLKLIFNFRGSNLKIG